MLKIGFIGSVFIGTIVASDTIWAMADIGNALMAWVNIIALILVGNKGVKIYKDYERQLKEGKEPVFDGDKLGLDNVSEVWK